MFVVASALLRVDVHTALSPVETVSAMPVTYDQLVS